MWTTQGKLFEVTRDALVAADLPRTALLRPPVQFGVGGAFQSAGIPQIGAIAGPEYLLTVVPNGDMDKLDERLAAKQIAWLADIAKRIDSIARPSCAPAIPRWATRCPRATRASRASAGPPTA